MKIIKPGIPEGSVRIHCQRCDCYFEAEKGEYIIEDGYAHARCPTCDKYAYRCIERR